MTVYKAIVHFCRYTLFGGYRWFEKEGRVQAETEDQARNMLQGRAENVALHWDQEAYYRNQQHTTVGYIEVKEE